MDRKSKEVVGGTTSSTVTYPRGPYELQSHNVHLVQSVKEWQVNISTTSHMIQLLDNSNSCLLAFTQLGVADYSAAADSLIYARTMFGRLKAYNVDTSLSPLFIPRV